METYKSPDASENSYIRSFTLPDIERVNPSFFFYKHEVLVTASLLKDLLSAKDPELSSRLDRSYFIRIAVNKTKDYLSQFSDTGLHENFIKLLSTERKKDQEKLLKGMSLTPQQLLELVIKAHDEFGYLYSRYSLEDMPKGFEDKTYPSYAIIREDGSIEKKGLTNLTDGQIKHIIQNRNKVICNFLEKDNRWHCFFITFKSLSGDESWKNGQAHFHYTSSESNLTKDRFIQSIKNGKYLSSKIHIDLFEYTTDKH